MINVSMTGCRVHLNPNGSDLRCGDKLNSLNFNPAEGSVQYCSMCRLKLQNATLLEMLNRRKGE